MALGCLATIGLIKPRNLTVVIMDNGIYQITGKQPAATASTADIVAIEFGSRCKLVKLVARSSPSSEPSVTSCRRS